MIYWFCFNWDDSACAYLGNDATTRPAGVQVPSRASTARRKHSPSGRPLPLWNPVDLGYLAVYAAHASLADTLGDNATQAKLPAGRLGTRDAVASLEDITAKGPLTLKNVIVLGNPFRFTKDNIDRFNF